MSTCGRTFVGKTRRNRSMIPSNDVHESLSYNDAPPPPMQRRALLPSYLKTEIQ
jgi:hypothetical protein